MVEQKAVQIMLNCIGPGEDTIYKLADLKLLLLEPWKAYPDARYDEI